MKKVSQEIRLQSQGDRVDWILGLYLEDTVDMWTAPFAVPVDGKSPKSLFQDSYSAKYYKHNLEARKSLTKPLNIKSLVEESLRKTFIGIFLSKIPITLKRQDY